MASKKQRKRKLRERRRRQAESKQRIGRPRRTPSWAGQKPWHPVKMQLYQAPEIFPETMTRDDRLAVIEQISEQAEESFQRTYFQLTEWFQQYDALYLLAYCAVYFLSHPEGTDPEARGRLDFHPFYLEILQAFALMQERSSSTKPLDKNAYELMDMMETVGDSISMRSWRGLSNASDEEIRQRRVLLTIRTHTTAVRNWSYPRYMRSITRDLAESIRSEFINVWKVDPVMLIDALFSIAAVSEERLNQHLGTVRNFYGQRKYQQIIQAYKESFPDIVVQDPEELFDLAGRNVQNLKAMLVAHSDLRLADHQTFTLGDIKEAFLGNVDGGVLERLFDELSFEFEELSEQDKEFVILDNPIWRKPFIRIDHGVYFSAIVGLIPHYALQILEALISADSNMEERYRHRKARYLEDELVRLFSESFPRAEVHRGTLWDDGMGSHGENDVVAIFDTVAIVAEAKSGLISPPASRGAPARLKRTVKELIDEPAQQAHDFISRLRKNGSQSGVEGTLVA